MSDDRDRGPMFPPRPNDSAAEARFKTALNKACKDLMGDLDAGMRFRTASPDAQRTRHLVKNKLREMGLMALHAMELAHSSEAADL